MDLQTKRHPFGPDRRATPQVGRRKTCKRPNMLLHSISTPDPSQRIICLLPETLFPPGVSGVKEEGGFDRGIVCDCLKNIDCSRVPNSSQCKSRPYCT